MARLEDLSDDILLLIIDQLQAPARDFDEKHPLLELAQVCKRLSRMAIPALYKAVAVRGIETALGPLLCRLSEDEDLARSVETLECHLGPFEYIKSDNVYQLVPRGSRNHWAVSNNWEDLEEGSGRSREEAMFTRIARLCSNIVHLRVPADLAWWHNCALFSRSSWWERLESVHIGEFHLSIWYESPLTGRASIRV